MEIREIEIITPELALITLQRKEAILLHYLSTVQITTNDEQKNCEDLLITARQALKEADAKRKECLEPAKLEQERINGLFKPYIDKLTIGIDSVNKALSTWRIEQKRIADEALLKAQIEQAEAIAASKITGEIIELPTEIIPKVQKTSQAHFGSVSYIDSFDIRITNPDLVPRDLCDPSLVKIRARVKSGIHEIPGVLITKKTVTVTRGR